MHRRRLPMDIPKMEDLQRAIINKIAQKSGKFLTLEEYKKLDSRKIGEMLGITTMRVTIIKKLFYVAVDLSRIRYKRALTTTLLKK